MDSRFLISTRSKPSTTQHWSPCPAYAADWRSSTRELYMFHIVLFMMRKIEQFYQETKSSYLSYYHENGCKIAAKNCEDKLVEFVERTGCEYLFRGGTQTLAIHHENAWRIRPAGQG